MSTQITTHNTDAKNRLLQQYKGKARIEGLIDAYIGDQIQAIEDALWPLFDRLDIDSQVGTQLDKIGEIVGQDRLGLEDDLYRIWLKAKIGQNVSEGDAERIISIWQLINSDATTIRLVEHFPAEVALYSDNAIDAVSELTTEAGDTITTEDGTPIVVILTAYMSYIFDFMQKIVSGGVKLAYIAVFDPDNAFSFAGSDSNTGGFGDNDDADVGGELSYIELP